jgi:hypothetical protein
MFTTNDCRFRRYDGIAEFYLLTQVGVPLVRWYSHAGLRQGVEAATFFGETFTRRELDAQPIRRAWFLSDNVTAYDIWRFLAPAIDSLSADPTGTLEAVLVWACPPDVVVGGELPAIVHTRDRSLSSTFRWLDDMWFAEAQRRIDDAAGSRRHERRRSLVDTMSDQRLGEWGLPISARAGWDDLTDDNEAAIPPLGSIGLVPNYDDEDDYGEAFGPLTVAGSPIAGISSVVGPCRDTVLHFDLYWLARVIDNVSRHQLRFTPLDLGSPWAPGFIDRAVATRPYRGGSK